jgi:hypothetical protein
MYWDQTYPTDPDEAAALAFEYWAYWGRFTREQCAFASLVARRIAEIACDGLKGKRK